MQKLDSKEEVVSAIKALHQSGAKINLVHMRRNSQHLFKAARRLFGSWRNAVEGAGINYKEVNRQGKRESVKWTKETVVASILELAEKEAPLYARYILLNHGPLYTAAFNCFGGWAQAIKAAGLDYETIRKRLAKKWTRELIVQEIKERWVAGLPLNEWEAGPILTSPARRLFGSWLKAIHAAGLTYNDIRKTKNRRRGWWTKKRVLMRIRQLEKAGVRLNPQNVQNKIDKSLFWYGCYFFGTWDQALEAAGFSYQDHYKRWSTRAWLNKLSDTEYKEKLESPVKRKRKT